MLTRLQDKAGIVVTPPLDPTAGEGSSAAAIDEPSVTLSYDEWNKNVFPWADSTRSLQLHRLLATLSRLL